MPKHIHIPPGIVKIIKNSEAGEQFESIIGWLSTADGMFYPNGWPRAEEIRRASYTVERDIAGAQGLAHAKATTGAQPLVPMDVSHHSGRMSTTEQFAEGLHQAYNTTTQVDAVMDYQGKGYLCVIENESNKRHEHSMSAYNTNGKNCEMNRRNSC